MSVLIDAEGIVTMWFGLSFSCIVCCLVQQPLEAQFWGGRAATLSVRDEARQHLMLVVHHLVYSYDR